MFILLPDYVVSLRSIGSLVRFLQTKTNLPPLWSWQQERDSKNDLKSEGTQICSSCSSMPSRIRTFQQTRDLSYAQQPTEKPFLKSCILNIASRCEAKNMKTAVSDKKPLTQESLTAKYVCRDNENFKKELDEDHWHHAASLYGKTSWFGFWNINKKNCAYERHNWSEWSKRLFYVGKLCLLINLQRSYIFLQHGGTSEEHHI